MKNNLSTVVIVIIFIVGMFLSSFNIQKANASNSIYIRSDGTIEPSAANITKASDSLYVFSDDNFDQILVEKDDITIDGVGYTLQNPEALAWEEYFDQNPPDPVTTIPEVLSDLTGFVLSQVNNVTIKNVHIRGFTTAVEVSVNSINNNILSNNITTTRYPSHIIRYREAPFCAVRIHESTSDTTVDNNTITDQQGVHAIQSDNNVISRNNITKGYARFDPYEDYGIYLFQSSYNIVSENNIEVPGEYGLIVEESSYNVVSGNNITAYWMSVALSGNNNVVTQNTLFYYIIPVNFYQNAIDHKIYHNNFIKASVESRDPKRCYPRWKVEPWNPSQWDDGYPSGGNYWSDYLGVDQYSGENQDQVGFDGIGDEPVVLGDFNVDNYPLMQLSGWIPTSDVIVAIGGGRDDVGMQSNAVIADVVATKNNIHCQVSGPSGQIAYVKIAVPVDVNTTTIKVFVNGTKLNPPPFPEISTNGTHYLVYFELLLSSHSVKIEFGTSNWLFDFAPYIALIFVIVIVVIIIGIVHRKRKSR